MVVCNVRTNLITIAAKILVGTLFSLDLPQRFLRLLEGPDGGFAICLRVYLRVRQEYCGWFSLLISLDLRAAASAVHVQFPANSQT